MPNIAMMKESIVLIAILAFILGGFFFLNRFYRNRIVADDHHDHHEGEDGVCCGRHSNCAKGYDNSNLYFDDEELDAYKGRKQEEYTESEIEEFRNVLYTMRSEEVDTWVRCLQTRGIEIPYAVKEEILLMLQ